MTAYPDKSSNKNLRQIDLPQSREIVNGKLFLLVLIKIGLTVLRLTETNVDLKTV